MFGFKKQSDEQIQQSLNMVLQKDGPLCSFLCEIPRVFVIPTKQPEKKYLVVWLYLQNSSDVTKELLMDVITKVISLFLKKSNLTAPYEGVEIVPSIRMQNGETDRIVRIAVWRGYYETWMEMKPKDIYSENPREGIQCGWYWDKGRVD